jgi:IS605 OrfB family transposase
MARIKGKTSPTLRPEFPALRKRLPSSWTSAYYVGTAGSVSSETIRKYIKTARALVRANDTMYHEDLAVKNMVQNHCLARSIHDAAWSQFIAILVGKAAEAGRTVVAVHPRGTSQTCVCGEPVPKDLSERWHHCPRCHLSLPRDQVSAMIVKRLGRSLQADAA